MTTLVVLVAIMPSDIYNMSVFVNRHLIDKANSDPFPVEMGIFCIFSLFCSTFCHKSVLAKHFLFLTLLLIGGGEIDHDTTACDKILVVGKSLDDGTTLLPDGAVGGTRIPWQREVMATSQDEITLTDDPLLVLLVEEKTVGWLTAEG